jgi:hypothetical protein
MAMSASRNIDPTELKTTRISLSMMDRGDHAKARWFYRMQ